MSESDEQTSRKRKLMALRAKAEKADEGEHISQNSNMEESGINVPDADNQPIKLKFRNYKPHDKKLLQPESDELVNKETNINSNESVSGDASGKVTPIDPVQLLKSSAQDIITQELRKSTTEEISLVPKKINADLKQQVAGKIEKLKKCTQKVILEIIREKFTNYADIDE